MNLMNTKFYLVRTDSNSGGNTYGPFRRKEFADNIYLKKIKEGWPCVFISEIFRPKTIREYLTGVETPQEELEEEFEELKELKNS